MVKECIVGYKHFNYDLSARTLSCFESSIHYSLYALNACVSIEESCLERKLQANMTLPLSCIVDKYMYVHYKSTQFVLQ